MNDLFDTIEGEVSEVEQAAALPIPAHEFTPVGDTSAKIRDIRDFMINPFFTMSTRHPVKEEIRVDLPNGKWIKATPSVHGLPTYLDADLLKFAATMIRARQRKGEPVSRNILINPREFLKWSGRSDGGDDYKRFRAMISRLRGTTIETNISNDASENQNHQFGFIEYGGVHEDKKTGRMKQVRLTLSDWCFQYICADQGLLTLSSNFFLIKTPSKRRLYEIVRAHVGHQSIKWRCGLDKLQIKFGSRSQLKEFRRTIKRLCSSDDLPEYSVHYDRESDQLVAFKRQPAKINSSLSSEDYDNARKIAGGYDIYYLEEEWRAWSAGKEAPKNASAAFLGFVKRFVEQKGPAR